MSAQLQDPIEDTDDFVAPHSAPDAEGIVAEAVKYGNHTMVRYTVKCPNCDWASHNYAKYKTALLIATEHKENSCLTGRRRSRNISIASTPDMKATTLFRTGKIN